MTLSTPHLFFMVSPCVEIKCGQQVAYISLSQLHNVAGVGDAALNTQWHRFYCEYKKKPSRAFAIVFASSCENPSYHSCLVVPTLPAPCRYSCSKHSLLATAQCIMAWPHLVWLHAGECITQGVTHKCNNPFDTEKKRNP